MAYTARKLDDRVYVAPQITEEEIAAIAAAGFRTIMNNRPDGEEPGQLTAARAAEVAKSHGLDYVHVPVNAQTMGPDVADRFEEVVQNHPGPILAHCRSGARCTQLWSLSQAKAGILSVDDILARASAAGYDLSGMRPLLERQAEA